MFNTYTILHVQYMAPPTLNRKEGQVDCYCMSSSNSYEIYSRTQVGI